MNRGPRATATWPLAAALVLCAWVFGCSRIDQSKKTLLLISGWSVSPDFQKLVVPFWIGHLNDGTLRGATAAELQTSYQYLVVFDLTAKGQFRFLPFTGDAPDAIPNYLGSFTSWSADSEKLLYYGGWRWSSGPWPQQVWHPSTIDLKTGAANQSDEAVEEYSKIYASPSGRYALITKSLNSMRGAAFLLWDTRTGTMRELLRSQDAPGWCPTEPVATWDADEKKVYITVSSRTPAGNEVWELCECPIDSDTTYTPETAHVLSSLDNANVRRPATEANCGVQFETDRNLQIVPAGAVKHSLLFYRGDLRTYGAFDVAKGHFEKLYFSPLLTEQEGGKVSLREEYRAWAWQDANMIAFVKNDAQGQARLWVEDPARPREAREVLPGRTVTSRRIQWCGSDWLVYEGLPEGEDKQKFPMREIRAVNAHTGEDKLLLSIDLQRQVLDEFSKKLAK